MLEKTRLWLGLGLAVALLAMAGAAVSASTMVGAGPADWHGIGADGVGGATGGDSLISRTPYEGEVPAIAYNPDDEQYLIVWVERTSEEESNIYGQIYSATGMAAGEAFHVATAANPIYSLPEVAAAYNPAHGQYLVVFHRLVKLTPNLGSNDIIGRIYSAQGVPQGQEFPISSHSRDSQSPAVAANAGDEYLVVWNEWTSGYWIYGQRVRFDGSLLNNPGTPQDESDPEFGFLISTEAHNQQNDPAVAYHEGVGEYLVVWHGVDNGYDIFGQRVIAADGALQGGELLISSNSDYQEYPATAYNRDAGEYLVVWQDGRDYWDNIYGQRLAANGSLLDNPDTGADETDPAVNFVICDAPAEQLRPAVVYNGGAGQYLVVWHDGRHESSSGWDVYGRRVAANGTLDEEGEFVISQAVGDQQYAAVAAHPPADPRYSQYLVVWQDERDRLHSHIYAQRVWWPGLLLGHDFALAPPLAAQDSPAIAYDSTHGWYLVVWADARQGDYDIYGQLHDRDGVPMNDLLIVYEGPGNQTEPAVVYNPLDGHYLVVWKSETGGNTFLGGRLVYAQGSVWPEMFTLSSAIGSLDQPAIAHNADPGYGNYLVVFTLLIAGTYEFDIHGWQVTANGEPMPGSFAICDEPGWQMNPAVAYSPGANEFLVVWGDARAGDYDIYGQRLEASMLPTSSEIAVATAAQDQNYPAVAYNPASHEYLVAWEDDRADDVGDIYVQRILDSGDLAGGNIAIPTSAAADARQRPAVVYIPDLDRYRILWQDKRDSATLGWDIYGQWLNADGTFPGTLDSPIVRYPGDQQYPAIAYDPGYDQALTVWQDGRSGTDTDIYGSMGALDRNPPLARFVRRPIFGQAGQVFGFNARPSVDDTTPGGDLRVRWDLDDDGSWDVPLSYQKLVTWTFGATGRHTVTLEVWDEANQVDSLSLPVFVYGAARAPSAPPPTAALVTSPTWGVAGTTLAFDGTGSTGSGPLQAAWDWENDGLFDMAFSPVLTASHAYTVAGDYTVRLLIQDTTTQLSDSAFQQITVQAGAPVDLEASPHTVTMVPGEVLHFRAQAWDEYGNRMLRPPATWSVTDPRAGEMGTSGVFTAGTEAGVFTNAIVVESGGVLDTASVTVVWPYRLYLPIVWRAGP
jgi:PKD repeat protein